MAESRPHRLPGGVPSAHVDTFAHDALPPAALWPTMDYRGIPELAYPDRLNCAGELLDRAITRGWGDRVVFRAPGATWTYADLLARANQIAHVLVDDLGLVAGNRVLLRGANSPMMAALWFAVLKAGGVVVSTVPLSRARELVFIADKARITLAITDARLAADCAQAMAQHADGRTRAGARVLEYHAPHGGSNGPSLEQLMAGKPTTFHTVETAADDVALIAFTSGTTGEGKGTMHFHRDVLAICDCFPRYVLRAEPDDIFIGSPPFAFTFGLGGLVLFPIRIGASAVLLEQATPPYLIQAIQDYRATTVFTAPTAYRAMLGMRHDFDLTSLRRCVSAGEALPLATFTAWQEATGLRIIDGIGATEILHIFISASGDDVRPGSTGRVVPGYDAQVVDDAMQPVPDGTIGRLAVRGPTGCRYLDNLERQRAYVREGWNLTGDSYIRDADGYFWYQARTDDMIISAGYNISGPEVEGVLLEHLAVQECGVIGVPDEQRGQIVKAFVVLKPGFERTPEMVKKLQDWVKQQLAPFKYPRAVEFVDAMPRTNTGKLQRFVLRDRARELAPESGGASA
jgi:2-aminobenzoate-CoA ligase